MVIFDPLGYRQLIEARRRTPPRQRIPQVCLQPAESVSPAPAADPAASAMDSPDSWPYDKNMDFRHRICTEAMNIRNEDSEAYSMLGFDLHKRTMRFSVKGHKRTPYGNRKYKLTLLFPPHYPEDGPVIKLDKYMFHPNVDGENHFWLEGVHSGAWHPMRDADFVIRKLIQAMLHPWKGMVCNKHAMRNFDDKGFLSIVCRNPVFWKDQVFARLNPSNTLDDGVEDSD